MTLEDLQDFSKSANRYLYSALAGALAGGGMGALTSSRGAERPGESEEERRNRIIRNALGMGLAGGAAGAAGAGVLNLLGDAAPGRTAAQDFVHNDTSRTGTAALGAAAGAGTGYRSPAGVDRKLKKIEDALTMTHARDMGYRGNLRPIDLPDADRATIDKRVGKQMDLHRKDMLGGTTNLKRMIGRGGVGAAIGFMAPEISDFITKDPGYAAAAGTGAGALLTPGGWKRKLFGAGGGGLAAYLFGLANEQTRPQE